MKLLLVIELDNTLVGNNRAITALNQRLEAIRNQIYLVYVTGRSYTSSRRVITKAQLLKPDYLIASLGTEIYQQGVLLEKIGQIKSQKIGIEMQSGQLLATFLH
ncbi:hypothetical protein ANSO36C_01960 [Nostoc cf. commune SO-36]|uniref:Sucrose phosphatase-like domain-containing protein n=1 Tax=Nostoc cf. commune SO-36 TaxID=449208 RepID=A0ABN6PVH1_NOSCO|nr:HAD family hydrolase [Nostoc commune]BDI14394.1 hypothetical protein ANSO36C_01960 [Nostoc cf. commune SO-36]